MELRQLEYFVAVAEERHFTRAATRCHIAQSGLSAAIRALERDLGAALLRRTTRTVSLTDAGRAFVPEAKRTLAAARAARAAVADVKTLDRGLLRVGVLQSMGDVGLPALLAGFRDRYPGVELRLSQRASGEMAELVLGDELDLAFTALPRTDVGGLRWLRILADEPVLVVSSDHPLAARGSARLADMEDEPMLDFHPEFGVRQQVDLAMAEAGLRRRVTFEANDTQTIGEMIRHGFGVAIMPRPTASTIPGVALVPLRPVPFQWELHVVHPPEAQCGRAALAMLRMLDARIPPPSALPPALSAAHTPPL